MTLSELIETQLKDIKLVQREAQRVTRTAEDLALPAQVLNARIARLDARIKGLQTQRDETAKRLEAAIAEQTELRDRLVKEAQGWADRHPPNARMTVPNPRQSAPDPTRPAPKRAGPADNADEGRSGTEMAVASITSATQKTSSKSRKTPARK